MSEYTLFVDLALKVVNFIYSKIKSQEWEKAQNNKKRKPINLTIY